MLTSKKVLNLLSVGLLRPTFVVGCLAVLASCGGGGGSATPAPVGPGDAGTGAGSGSGSGGSDDTGPNFSDVDDSFQAFIDSDPVFDGISYVLVNSEGVMHTAVFGDHTEDTVVLLASTSKVPAVMTILALEDDPSIEFSITAPVSTYLAYDGPYADRTVEQMVSNTSGIPGLRLLPGYGAATGPTLEDFNHLCQFGSQAFFDFESCGQTLVQNELPTSRSAGSVYDYGGSQWQIAGVTASTVANATWNQLVDQYLGAHLT